MGQFGKRSSHHHGRGENSVPASLEPALQAAVSWAAAARGCGDGRAQGWLPAAAPVPCTRSMPADFTQLLMIPASSLRTSVTDGGSAGLRPLGKAEQWQLLDSGFLPPVQADFKDRDWLVCASHLYPGNQVAVSNLQCSWATASSLPLLAGASSAPGPKADG